MKRVKKLSPENQELLDLSKRFGIKTDEIIKNYGINFALELLLSIRKTDFKSPNSVELIYPQRVNTNELKSSYLDMIIEAGFHFKEFSENYKYEGVQTEPLYQIICIRFK